MSQILLLLNRTYSRNFILTHFLLILIISVLVACGSLQSTNYSNISNAITVSTAYSPTIQTTPTYALQGKSTNSAKSESDANLTQQNRWLKGIPCSPPCWENITPGHTSAEDALKILQQNSLIRNVSLISEKTQSFIKWDWSNGAGNNNGGQMAFNSQTNDHVIYFIYPKLQAYKLKDITQIYGQPNFVVANPDLVEPYNSEKSNYKYNLYIIYLNLGFVLNTTSYHTITINNDTMLDRLYFFVPTVTGLNTLIEIPTKLMVPWQGFKDYYFYCRQEIFEPIGGDCSKLQNNKSP